MKRSAGPNVDRDSLALLLARGLSVETIAQQYGKHPSTVAYWMAKHELKANGREKHAPRGGIEREQLEAFIASGKTIAEIADEVAASKATVRYWMRRYGLRTQNKVGPRRPGPTVDLTGERPAQVTQHCLRHGETVYVLEGRGYYRCKRCRNDGIARHRRRLKQALVAEAGGCCQRCGHDRCVTALAFHHLDPLQKRLGISAGGLTLGLSALREEVAKCMLLCANCHAEVESGLADLPVQYSPTHERLS